MTNGQVQVETTPQNGGDIVETAVQKPRYSYGKLASLTVTELKKIAKELGVAGCSSCRRKEDLLVSVLKANAESQGYRFGGGTLETLPEGFGFPGRKASCQATTISIFPSRRYGDLASATGMSSGG